MKAIVEKYFDQQAVATTEAERANIKAEFKLVYDSFTAEQRQEIDAIVKQRMDALLEKLIPVDTAIEEFNQRKQATISNAA